MLSIDEILANEIFHYTRCITPKSVTSWLGPTRRHCARATQLLVKKYRSGGEPLATLHTSALPLDQLDDQVQY